jgi:glutathione synthase/RimK-type ligase-like ATP-grasp enzyme
MTKLTNLDVLIVYSENLAASAGSSAAIRTTPFSALSKNKSYNIVYGYFLEICAKFNLSAGFASSADIIGPGFCKSFWTFKEGQWAKVNHTCYSPLIFDKFSPKRNGVKTRRQLLFSDPKIKPFNDPGLFDLFFDKQLTYEKLSAYSIPTISVGAKTLQSVDDACRALAKLMVAHPGSKDFSSDLVMTDRFGAGGRHVYKFKKNQSANMLAVILKNTRISYIIQPFAEFDRGFSYQNCPASTDIRLIYLKGKIVQSYIRVAKSGEFRCNEHQGGLLTYLPLTDIPAAIVTKSNLVAQSLNNQCSLFALDFIITNTGNSYLLEGNTGPGLDWNMSLPKNETCAKELIQLVVSELAARSVV